MARAIPAFSLGVEEEYLLIERESRDLVTRVSDDFVADCQAELGDQVTPEFLQCQIEVRTTPCPSVQKIRAELSDLRRGIAKVARAHDYGVVAASTHPFATWVRQNRTPRDRYDQLSADYQAAARRLLICGMHVHVGVNDDELRIDLANQFAHYLPVLVALTTSSPFWEAHDSGLQSYRLTVWDALPRTGLPPRLHGWHEFRQLAQALIDGGAIEDTTKLWWDIRPSGRFPTLEIRIADICTHLEDAAAVVALTQCIMRMLWRLSQRGQQTRLYSLAIVNENRWRAMRYGIEGKLIDVHGGSQVPIRDLIESLVEEVAEDAKFFGCTEELDRVRAIAGHGTSAQRQRAVFQEAKAAGADDREALRAVVDWLQAATLEGLDPPVGEG